ncbi:MAG TPA: L,D-transpeptidase family protein [Woeseiaceae bacterium]|jgi:L,D-transpeptidase ErfK/SrfK|nr:L,D-transpeptidase family protein [Woeseiaceae bacterium]
MNRAVFLTLIFGAFCATTTRAEIYELPPEGFDVVGALSTVTARYEDTLVDIARRHGLGYEDVVRANPDVNVWVPGEGTEVILPTRFVLPSGPRRGVVLNLAEYRMYYFPEPRGDEPAYVMTYPISIGRMDWETPLGLTRVISKVRNPSWYPPESVLEEHAADGNPLPRIVPPGPDNPLGKYAMRLGLPGYLIHSTNRPAGVGMRVTHGCIRMFPEDIEYLFGQVGIDTPVRIINEPVKIGWDGDRLVMEAHPVLEVAAPVDEAAAGDDTEADTADGDEAAVDEVDLVARDPLAYVIEQFVAATGVRPGELDWRLAEELVDRADGIPTEVGEAIKNAATGAAFEID